MSDRSTEQYILWLDQVERERDELRAEVERLKLEVDGAELAIDDGVREIHLLRAANKRMRAENEWLKASILNLTQSRTEGDVNA